MDTRFVSQLRVHVVSFLFIVKVVPSGVVGGRADWLGRVRTIGGELQVSFPMFLRVDENPAQKFTLFQTAIEVRLVH